MKIEDLPLSVRIALVNDLCRFISDKHSTYVKKGDKEEGFVEDLRVKRKLILKSSGFEFQDGLNLVSLLTNLVSYDFFYWLSNRSPLMRIYHHQNEMTAGIVEIVRDESKIYTFWRNTYDTSKHN
jgi:hypothetical protein